MIFLQKVKELFFRELSITIDASQFRYGFCVKKMKYSYFIALFLLIVSCSNNSELNDNKINSAGSEIQANDSLKAPQIICINNPIYINSDTCKNPRVNVIPTKPTSETITLKDGKLLKLAPPETKPADFLSIMQNYTTDQGIALDAVSCAIKDKKGNLWFGTDGGGVSRYDGKSFTNFTTIQGLANNVVFSIAEDKNGNIWFGTNGGGVSRYDGTSFTSFTSEQGLANNFVKSILEDKKGNLWFGTNGGGVSMYNGTTWKNFSTKQGELTNDIVFSILEDKKGNIWFGTNGGGVSKYDGKSFKNYSTANSGLAHNVVRSIELDKKGNIWFGTNGGGISKYDGKSFKNYTVLDGLVSNFIFIIKEDKVGNVWFGSDMGLTSYDGKRFSNLTTTQGLANNVVRSITEDESGNLWIGTFGGGVSRYDGKAIINYTAAQGLADNFIFSSMEEKNGNLWFGTYGGGVSKYDGKSITNYSQAQGLANKIVLSIFEDNAGIIWFGTQGGGVSRYDGKTFTNYNSDQGLAKTVYSIIQDKKGNIWFGTNAGVSCYNGKSFINYTKEQGLTNNFVKCILEDKKGNLWLCTNGGGVSYFNGKSFTNYTTDQGLANNFVFSIAEDKAGNVWFGTNGGGVSRFDGKSFLNYTVAQGLPDNVITQLAITKEQNIALGTNFGLAILPCFISKKNKIVDKNIESDKSKLPSQNSLSNEELKNYTPIFEIFNSATGFPIKDVNAGQNSMFVDSRGELWIGTGSAKTALVRFNYNALHHNKQAPIIAIKNIRIKEQNVCFYDLKENVDSTTLFQQEVLTYGHSLLLSERDSLKKQYKGLAFEGVTKFYPLPTNFELPYKNNNLTFEFNAIEAGKPFLVNYQYILEGYDKEWSPVLKKTSATFGNIFEGSYTFKVKAQSPEGVWSNPISYSFKVLPPWYRTWWMYSLYFIVFVSSIIIIVWLNGRRLRARADELAEEVKRATLTIIEQKKVVEDQKLIVELKHKEITDSINYAERIQRSFLATKELLDQNLQNYFVFFQPKDVVSGDFYWASKLSNGNFALVTADSTGHGVPGAIMSILNISCLEKSIEEKKLTEPSEILNHTRSKIIERLKKDGSVEGGKDGMDASLISFDFKNNKLFYAAANNPVWIVRENKLLEFAPDKMPLGKHDKDTILFKQTEIELQKDDLVYALTDGMPDQFGGPKGKKYMYKKLKELLVQISNQPMNVQKEILKSSLNNWKGELEQVDDVCVIGVRV